MYACVKNPYPFIKYLSFMRFLSLSPYSLSSLYLTNVLCKNKKSILSLFFSINGIAF